MRAAVASPAPRERQASAAPASAGAMPRTAAPDGGMASAAGLIPAPRESIASYAAARAGCVQRVAMPRPPSGGPPVVQRVRRELGESALPIKASELLAAVRAYSGQIGDLGEDPREMAGAGMSAVEITRLITSIRGEVGRLQALQADPTFTQENIDNPQNDNDRDFKAVWNVLGELREILNRPYEIRRLIELSQARKGASAAAAAASASGSRAAPSPGPKKKGTWAKVYPGLGKLKPTNVFYQFVPSDAATIQAALKSQSILDAVYHHDKAFWVANPNHYEVGTSHGKVRMEYTFDPEAAQSLVTDYLLCATEDIDGTNPEDYTGETGHPDYTLWKTNELGAYGIGSRRLAQLAPHVKIRAFDPSDREIVPAAEKRKEKEAASAAVGPRAKGKSEPRKAADRHNAKAQEGAPAPKPAPLAASGSAAPITPDRLRIAAEPAVDPDVADTVRVALVQHQIDPGPILVVNGDRWTCYIRAVLQHFGRIRDYVYVVGNLENANIDLGSGVEVGSAMERRVLAMIERMVGQRIRVTAFDAATPNILHQTQPRPGQDARDGSEVRLIRTGVHFSLILAAGGGAPAPVAQVGGGGAAPAVQIGGGGAAPAVNNNNGSAS